MWFSVFWEVLNFLILTAISFVAGLCFWVGADPENLPTDIGEGQNVRVLFAFERGDIRPTK